MADIIDLGQKRLENSAHVQGEAFCMGCQHVWRGVWPIGATELDCPSCGSKKGRPRFEISPQPGKQVWTCVACNNQLFNLLPDRVHCPGCGKQWGYEELV